MGIWVIVPITSKKPKSPLAIAIDEGDQTSIEAAKKISPKPLLTPSAIRLLYCHECVLYPNNTRFSQETTQLYQDTVATCSALDPDTLTARVTLAKDGDYPSLVTHPYPAVCGAFTPPARTRRRSTR